MSIKWFIFRYYLLSLYHSDNNNITIFRIMSLFLENRNNSEIYGTIKEFLPKIPTYKYIIMLPQLVPHLTDVNPDHFSQEICRILEKCSVDHPHHTLPLLLSLVNANKDRDYTKESTKTSQNDARMSAAVKMLNRLKKTPSLMQIIDRLQQLSLALIDLAYYKDSNERKKKFDIPSNHRIRRIRNFDDVLLPTYHLTIKPNSNYTNIIGKSFLFSINNFYF